MEFNEVYLVNKYVYSSFRIFGAILFGLMAMDRKGEHAAG